METKELKLLKEQKRVAENALNHASSKLSELKTRLIELENQLPGLEKKADEARAKKERGLEKFVLGELNQGDVEECRMAERKAGREFSEAVEVIEALKKGISGLENSLPDLQSRALNADRVLWGAVTGIEKEKVNKSLGDGLIRAYAAQLLSGYGNWLEFLQVLSGQYPDHEKVKEFQTMLKLEYGLADDAG